MPFDPPTGSANVNAAKAVASNYLNNGHYDYFNISDIQDQPIFNGTETTTHLNTHDQINNVGPVKGGGGKVTQTSLKTSDPESMVQQFADMWVNDPGTYAAIQSALYASGAYGSSKPTLGTWNVGKDGAAMATAMRNYLAVVNPQSKTPLTFSDFLSRTSGAGIANGGGLGAGGGGASRAPLQLTSTATLQQYSQQAGQSELGRNTDATEQGAFVNAYHGQEQAQYNGAKEAAGSPDAEAKSFIDKNNNAEMQTHLQAGYAAKMLQMLGVSN